MLRANDNYSILSEIKPSEKNENGIIVRGYTNEHKGIVVNSTKFTTGVTVFYKPHTTFKLKLNNEEYLGVLNEDIIAYVQETPKV